MIKIKLNNEIFFDWFYFDEPKNCEKNRYVFRHFYYRMIDYKCFKLPVFRNSSESSVVICVRSLIDSPRRTRVAMANDLTSSCARVFDGNGSAVSAFKVPRHGYLSSFCRVHALIGGVINHIAVARFAHPLRSCRYALLLYAPPWTWTLTRDGLIAYHVVMAIIISRCWPCSTRGPREEFRQLTNNKFNSPACTMTIEASKLRRRTHPPRFYRATRKTDRRHFSRSLGRKIDLLLN